jgi:hypothetical protein
MPHGMPWPEEGLAKVSIFSYHVLFVSSHFGVLGCLYCHVCYRSANLRKIILNPA